MQATLVDQQRVKVLLRGDRPLTYMYSDFSIPRFSILLTRYFRLRSGRGIFITVIIYDIGGSTPGLTDTCKHKNVVTLPRWTRSCIRSVCSLGVQGRYGSLPVCGMWMRARVRQQSIDSGSSRDDSIPGYLPTSTMPGISQLASSEKA